MAIDKGRRASLDGLRGVAALIVVTHHLLLTLPWFAGRVFLGLLGEKNSFTVSVRNVFEYTPLHVFYGGAEAVIIFFGLSGYVLAFSVSKREILTYLRCRLVRLYLPILVVTTLSSILVLLFPRKTVSGGSWWINSHPMQSTVASFLRNIWVVDGTDWLNSSLWTMKYEIIFSLAVVVFAGFVFRQSYLSFSIAVIGLGCLILVGMNFNFDLLSWLPVFFAGSAIHWLPEKQIRFSCLQIFLGIFILYLPWCFAGFGYSLSSIASRILMTSGALMVVDVCRRDGNPVSSLLSTRLPVLVGKYSYSLYLIHAPVLTTIWFVMGSPDNDPEWLIQIAISVMGIAASTVFVYQIAEKPSLNWIKKHKFLERRL